jgi:hypothetical protein
MSGRNPLAIKRTHKGLPAEIDNPIINAEFEQRLKYAIDGSWSFGRDGGAIGSFSFIDDDGEELLLPARAVVTRAYYFVEVTCTSATDAGEGALSIPTDDADGLLAAVAISAAADWDAGWHDCIQDGAAANFSEQCTAARKPHLVISVEDFTAGEVRLFLEYIVPALVPAA